MTEILIEALEITHEIERREAEITKSTQTIIGTITRIRINRIIKTENKALTKTAKNQTNIIIIEIIVTTEILIDKATGSVESRTETDLTLGIGITLKIEKEIKYDKNSNRSRDNSRSRYYNSDYKRYEQKKASDRSRRGDYDDECRKNEAKKQ